MMNRSLERERPTRESLLTRCQQCWQEIESRQREIARLNEWLAEAYFDEDEGQLQRAILEREQLLVDFGLKLLSLQTMGVEVLIGGAPLSSPEKAGDDQALATQQLDGAQSELPPKREQWAPVSSPSTSRTLPEQSMDLLQHTLEPKSALNELSEQESVDHDPAADTLYEPAKVESISLDRPSSFEQPQQIDKLSQFDLSQQDTPISEETLEELKAKLNTPHWDEGGAKAEAPEPWMLRARTVVSELGAPKRYSANERKQQLILLDGEVENAQQFWRSWPRNAQHAMITFVTARLRNIQEQLGEEPLEQERMARLFRRLTRFSNDFRPGFVHGLSRDKQPQRDNWSRDEAHAWRVLTDLLQIERESPPSAHSPVASAPVRREQPLELRELDVLLKSAGAHDEKEFEQLIRGTVDRCLKVMEPQDEELCHLLRAHVQYLSGSRFKKLRRALLSTG